MLTPRIVRRFRPAYVIAGGMAVSATGFVLLALVDDVDGTARDARGGAVVFSLGLAPVVTLTTDLVVGSAPPERAGAASAISETSPSSAARSASPSSAAWSQRSTAPRLPVPCHPAFPPRPSQLRTPRSVAPRRWQGPSRERLAASCSWLRARPSRSRSTWFPS